MEYNNMPRAPLDRSMGMQARKPKKRKTGLQEATVGVVNENMVNPEIQNDDVLDPTKLMGL